MTLVTSEVSKERNRNMIIDMMRKTQQTTEDPVPDTATGERKGDVAANMMSSKGRPYNSETREVTGLGSGGVTTNVRNW